SNEISSNDVVWKKGGAKVLLTVAYDEAMQNKEIILDVLQNINKILYSNLDYINEMQNYYEYVLCVYKEALVYELNIKSIPTATTILIRPLTTPEKTLPFHLNLNYNFCKGGISESGTG
ncbi:2362_t:CDS:2, partial [Dentiscutata heterogama]